MERELKIHGVYKHFKGDCYLVEDVANHSETKEKYVVYRRLYGDNSLWIRPLDMFLSEVDHEKYQQMLSKNIDLNCKIYIAWLAISKHKILNS